jgi:hypothetical protein
LIHCIEENHPSSKSSKTKLWHSFHLIESEEVK